MKPRIRLNEKFCEGNITINLNDTNKSIYNYYYDYNFFLIYFFLGKKCNSKSQYIMEMVNLANI